MKILEGTKGNEGSHGNHFWDLKLDDGRKAWGLFKFDVEVGEEVVVHSEKDGKLRVKRPEKDDGSGPPLRSTGRTSQASFSPDTDPVQKLIVRQSAIKAAVAMSVPLMDRKLADEQILNAVENWIDYFERKTWEAVESSGRDSQIEPVHTPVVGEVGQGAVTPRPEGSNGEVSIVQVLMQKTKAGITPEDFQNLLVACGCEDLQKSTLSQRLALMNQMESLSA